MDPLDIPDLDPRSRLEREADRVRRDLNAFVEGRGPLRSAEDSAELLKAEAAQAARAAAGEHALDISTIAAEALLGALAVALTARTRTTPATELTHLWTLAVRDAQGDADRRYSS